METEVGLFSENAVRRAGLTDVFMRAGFLVRAFHVPVLLQHERLVRRAAAMIVDLHMERHAPGEVIATIREAMPGMPRFVVGSQLQFSSLEPGEARLLAEGDERPHRLADSLRRALVEGDAECLRTKPNGDGSPFEHLTPRQRDVLRWLAVGSDNLKIAAELGVGERAVKLHVTSLLKRFALDNRTELALLAWRAGFRPPND